jgi:pimeloyl-ACP methyl ester carboxylesterase
MPQGRTQQDTRSVALAAELRARDRNSPSGRSVSPAAWASAVRTCLARPNLRRAVPTARCANIVGNVSASSVTAAVLLLASAFSAVSATVELEDYFVPAQEPGIQLFVRNKRPFGMAEFTAERTVLFVHGSTYPAEATFDLRLDGYSWMDFIAGRGFDVYLLDLRGYGRSSRPKEMAQAPGLNEPIVTTEVAVSDVSAVVADILRRRRVTQLNLIGWSWGTTIVASFTIQNPGKVGRLILYGPQWLGRGSVNSKLGAYRTVNRLQARQHWFAGVPEERKQELVPSDWFERWAEAIFASDAVGAAQNPPVIRAPNGTLHDSQKYWRAGVPFYDPSGISAPVLLVNGEWDRDTPSAMSQALFSRLKNAAWRRWVVVGEATHMLMLEKNRQDLFDEAQIFLERKNRPIAVAARETRLVDIVALSEQQRAISDPAAYLHDRGEQHARRQPGPGTVLSGASSADRAVKISLGSMDNTAGRAEPSMTTVLLKRGEELLRLGDISAARLFYRSAADGGSARAMTALAKTYDPAFIGRGEALALQANPEKALALYRRAAALDNLEAVFCAERITALSSR